LSSGRNYLRIELDCLGQECRLWKGHAPFRSEGLCSTNTSHAFSASSGIVTSTSLSVSGTWRGSVDYLRMACGSINASLPTHSRDFWIKLARYAASCLRRLASQRALAKGTEERVLALVSQQKRHFVDVASRVRKQLPPTRAAHRVQENLETGAFAAKAALQGLTSGDAAARRASSCAIDDVSCRCVSRTFSIADCGGRKRH